MWSAVAATATPLQAPTSSDGFERATLAVMRTLERAGDWADRERIAALQVLFDRHGVSPGVIDGLDTPRFRAARSAFIRLTGESLRIGSGESVAEALASSGGPAFVRYRITRSDVEGPFLGSIPVLYTEQSRLRHIGYRTAREMLAERFHMDEDYLAMLNPGVDFDAPGVEIVVAAPGAYATGPVVRIEADKSRLQVRAFGSDGALVAVYPASIGSSGTPSPSGTHIVVNKAANPVWTYNPLGNAQPGVSPAAFTLAPGPNNPVGSAWIGLSRRGYGIHGTPEPSLVGIEQSVGCIRLTNWDALELAKRVRSGVRVDFID